MTLRTSALSTLARTASPLTLLVLSLLAPATLLASPAHAHAGLTGSDPAESATLAAVPERVVLDFSEEVREPAFVVVTAPDRSTHQDGDPQIDGASLVQPLDATTLAQAEPNGTWTIAYRVVSADGHPIQGQLTFDVEGATAPSSPSESPAPTPGSDDTGEATEDGDSDRSLAPFVVAGLAAFLVSAAAVVSTRRARRGQRDGGEQ